MTRRPQIVAAMATLSLLALAPSAAAQVEARYGLGSRATAMGGAFTAVADDVSAVHYNPAGLALRSGEDRVHGVDLHVGFRWAHPALSVRLGRVVGGELVFDQEADLEAASEIRHEVQDTVGLSFGVRLDLNKILGFDSDLVGVSAGLVLFMPLDHAFRWNVLGGHQLQWPMYLDRNQSMSILPAVAVHILDVVALGIGFRTSIDIEANTEFVVTRSGPPEIGAAPKLDGQLGNQSRIAGKLAPTFSVLARPLDWLSLGLIVRLPVASDDWGYTDIDTTQLQGIGLGSLSYTHRFAHYANPLEVAFGVALEPLPTLTVSLDGAWADWTSYLDSNHEGYGGKPFRATFTGRVGAAWEVCPSAAVMAGYGYAPTPFDNGGSWTNFVDNDRHLISAGGQLDLMAALGMDRSPIRLGFHTQLQVLRDHREVKDWRAFRSEAEAQANPGWPGWLSSGWVLDLGLSVDAEF